MELHIPQGINYECTGCGKCCTGWTVPMTPADYDRVSEVDWGKESDKYAGVELFRELKDYEKKGTPYSHAIRPGPDGYCPFLVDNLCFVHGQYGSKFKPSMCQLFPYCFNETPSGIYATVSFVSMGVLYNSGKALIDQRDYLEDKLKAFQELYPDHHPNWSKLQLAVGQPMSWHEYLEHEAMLIKILNERSTPIEERMLRGSDYLFSKLASPQTSNPSVQPALKKLDRHLLVALHRMYFPAKPLGKGECDFNVLRFGYQVLYQGTAISFPTRRFSFDELHNFPWPAEDREIEDLIYRYFFSRIFGKLYFGAGYGQLSLITGFHHLILILGLIKLQAKAWALTREAKEVSMVDMVATIRELEKRLGESRLGGYEAAVWELLMQSRSRIRRVLAFC
jgi:Fe-S-cluster containining protein